MALASPLHPSVLTAAVTIILIVIVLVIVCAGEGNGDHSCWGLVRDHKEPALYWRDATNPTFRKISVKQVLAAAAPHGPKKRALKMETGPYFIDMTKDMR